MFTSDHSVKSYWSDERYFFAACLLRKRSAIFTIASPEIVSIFLCLLTGAIKMLQVSSAEWICLVLVVAILVRSVWNIALVIHGLGHAIVASILDRDPTFLQLSNVLEQRSIGDFWRSFMPCMPTFIPSVNQESALWIEVGDRNPWKVRLKGLAGQGIRTRIGERKSNNLGKCRREDGAEIIIVE
jgi:hypothetical protein